MKFLNLKVFFAILTLAMATLACATPDVTSLLNPMPKGPNSVVDEGGPCRNSSKTGAAIGSWPELQSVVTICKNGPARLTSTWIVPPGAVNSRA